MLYGILLFIHIMVCIGLIFIVLIQSGRGGGLADSLSSAESIFGTKTNAFLTKTTTVFAVIFFATCLSLAFISKQRSKSLLDGKAVKSTVVKAKDNKPAEKKPEDVKPEPKAQEISAALKEEPQPVEAKK